MNIFEQLNTLLSESEDKTKIKESDIPIHPEMETKEQGEMAAAEKILKLFQKLSMGSGSKEDEVKDGRPEIPDDMIDPMLKERPKSLKDRTFEKNKLAGWDEESEDKIEKEVEVDSGDGEDDEFDDFDYRDNSFGDEEDDDFDTPESDGDDDDRSEDEKLRDSIEDAIDSLNDDSKGSGGDGDDDGDDSGADWGEDDGGESGESGESGKESGQSGQKSGKESGQSGQEGGQGGASGQSGESGQEGEDVSNGSGSGSNTPQSKKQKRLEDLKKALDSEDMQEFNDRMGEIKDAVDESNDDGSTAGHIETPADDIFKDEMRKAGFDDKTIDGMSKKKNTGGADDDYNEGEMEKLKKEVIDGLERTCEKKGGSALASTIVKNSLKRKLNNDEWRELLELFLKAKSVNSGEMTKVQKGIKWGNKNHLWRDAILPARAESKGTIQNIYCFVDFSGSVNKDLVHTFIGRVIDLCLELKYTTIKVYGFGDRLSLPRTLDERSFSKGTDIAFSQTWKFIDQQNVGGGTENFYDVTLEINDIKEKERDAIILIFGDALWENPKLGPKCLKYEINDVDYLDDICVLTYFRTMNSTFVGCINLLKEIVGLKHIITTKETTLYIDKK